MKDVSSNPYTLPQPELSWDEQGAPHSLEYDDIYFSRQHGLQETEYVFLEQNHLSQRWQNLPAEHAGHFTIAETGFGTGLNFLAAAKLWLKSAPSSWRLHFISVEKLPLSKEELERALSIWPEFTDLGRELIECYPSRMPGFHRCSLSNGRITLQLLFGDAAEQFGSLQCCDHPQLAREYGSQVDAWFLDGFAPAKNPQMWSPELFASIGALSRSGTTFATFTAAGIVKRGLKSQGFEIEKVAGFGHKREMLRGSIKDSFSPEPHRGYGALWNLSKPPEQLNRVAVLGAGIAGATTARALADRGIEVELIERHDRAGAEASGNPQGVLYTKLSHQAGTLNRFTLASYLFALRYYPQLFAQGVVEPESGDLCGVLQLAFSEREQRALKQIIAAFDGHQELVQLLSAEQASRVAGITLTTPALWFPKGGWLTPPSICQQLLNHPNIKTRFNTQVEQLNYSGSQWHLSSTQNQHLLSADCVVIAAASSSMQIAQCDWLPLKPIRGQVTTAPASESSSSLKSVICHEGYISPALNQHHCFGATFDHNDFDGSVRDEDHLRNRETLESMLPNLLPECALEAYGGRTSYRCTTPDYAPLSGPAPDLRATLERFGSLRKNARYDIDQPGANYPSLYLNVGHGSRGLTSAPICAELIASQICKEFSPLPRDLTEALAPTRFLIRDMIRGRR